jgi:hypothetical protein
MTVSGRAITEMILCVIILILALGLVSSCTTDPRAPNPLTQKQIEKGLSEILP